MLRHSSAGFALPGPLRQLLTQVAQIYFQSSALTGLVMLAALAAVRPWAAAGMVWASLVALVVTRLARLERATGESGLFGYNAALTGAGMLSLFTPRVEVFAYVAVVSGLGALISARWVRWARLPPLTILFVLAMWGALGLGARLGGTLELLGCPDGAAIVPCGVGLGAALGGLGGLLGAEAQAVGLAVNVGLTVQAQAVFP